VAKKLIKALKEIEEREFKALVLRINSPGGSVGASQEIHDAIEKLKEKGVKVVASFGDISASGGVYISCAADQIVSNPGTITGSIGVIMHSSNFKTLYQKIGIESEVVKSGPYKDMFSSHRALSEEEKVILQDMINNAYEQFVGVVAKGRNIEVEKVKEFADGRIFTGDQALELGMVDKLGSLKDAINYAAELVGIEDEPKIINFTQKKSKISTMLSSKMQHFELMHEYSAMPLWLMPGKII
jgi:protease-4